MNVTMAKPSVGRVPSSVAKVSVPCDATSASISAVRCSTE